MSDPARVGIIIVNWNGKIDTLECLASLRSDDYANKRIYLVDNGSSDDSVLHIRQQFPEACVLETKKNLGFTGGNNIGIGRALADGCDYCYFLNNDTTSDPDALSGLLLVAAECPQAGILTPVIGYFDRADVPWFAGSHIDQRRAIAVHDNSNPPKRTDPPRQLDWASGCAMLIPSQVLRRTGGFDDRFFLNWEDVDLSLRVRAMGKTILLVPASRIYHKVGRTIVSASGAGTYYYVRNHLLLARLHFGASVGEQLRLAVAHLAGSLRNLGRGDANAGRNLVVTVRGLFHHLIRRYGALNRS